MAKRKGRRTDWTRYMNGSIDHVLQLSTLAAKTAIKSDVQQVVVDTTRVSSIKATYTLADYTKGTNDGPIIIGVAHSDYSSVEIDTFLETADSWDRGNLVTREIRSRRIRIIGVFDSPDSAGNSSRLNDGKPIRTKLNWLLSPGDKLSFWAYNTGTSALATTDPRFSVFGKANLWQV